MKETPWQDILAAEDWRKIVQEYQTGAKAGVEKGPLRKLGVSLGIACPVPPELTTITQHLTAYSQLKKDLAKNLPPRIQLLRAIAMQGQAYLTKHSLPHKPKDKSTFDYDVAKLVRRATRKANYLAKLKEHVDAGDVGFAGGRRTLLDYLISKESRNCPGLVGVNSADMMEKVDPWHRGYDLKRTSDPGVPFSFGGGSILGFAFTQWQREQTDVPFFLWLEGHGFCTGRWDTRSQDRLDTDAHIGNVRQVVYRDPEGGLADKIMLIGPSCGQLIAYTMDEEGDLTGKPYDTTASRAGTRNVHMDAYAWSKESILFAAPHEGGSLHHSSFTGGSKVRCAGFIRVAAGKVLRVDNDSGHYKPPPHLLREFAKYLQAQGVLDAAAAFDLKGSPEVKGLTYEQLLAWRPAVPTSRPWPK